MAAQCYLCHLPILEVALKGIILGFVLRAGGGWSGDLMIADCEDLQESKASEIYVKRSESQEVVVKKRMRISVCKGNYET